MIPLFALGFLVGIRHAFEPDHVAAVSVFSSTERNLKASSQLGVVWALGHAGVLVVAGIALLLFKLSIPGHVSQIFEFAIAFLLIALGVHALRALHRKEGARKAGSGRKLFFVGMLHGLAGSSAFTLLIAASADSFLRGILFLGAFSVGSIFGMFLAGVLLGTTFLLARKKAFLQYAVQFIAGLVSIGAGIFLLLDAL